MNFYTYFELSETATYDEIKKSYYKKMMEVHPDKNNGNTTESAQITALAWETLKDSVKRAEYDSKLKVNRAIIEGLAFCEEIELGEFNPLGDDDYSLECRCGGYYKISLTDIKIGFNFVACSNCSLKIKGLNNVMAHNERVLIMADFSKIFDPKTDIQNRKEIAIKILSDSCRVKGAGSDFENCLNSKCLEHILLSAADRELQLYILQMVISKNLKVSFRNPNFRKKFKSVKLGNFSDSAREFLKNLDYSNDADYHMKEIEITKGDFTQIGSGWIDFNCKSLGFTLLFDDEESYTEIKYSSISSWYIKDCSSLIFDVQNGLLNITIKLEGQIQELMDAVRHKLSMRILRKYSETRNIIVLNCDGINTRSRRISTECLRKQYIKEICKSLNISINTCNYARRLRIETGRLIAKKVTRSIKNHFRNVSSLMENLGTVEF